MRFRARTTSNRAFATNAPVKTIMLLRSPPRCAAPGSSKLGARVRALARARVPARMPLSTLDVHHKRIGWIAVPPRAARSLVIQHSSTSVCGATARSPTNGLITRALGRPRGTLPAGSQGPKRCVRLHFPHTTNKESLYAPGSILRLWSGVMRTALENTSTATVPVPAQQEQANRESKDAITSVPLDDTDTAAWEDALRLMYPSVPLFQVTCNNASRLLLLADKYDIPCITEHVKLYLSGQEGGTSRLQQHLTEGNVFAWLRITSRVGLADSVKECIAYIISESLPLPQGYIGSVQPDILQELFNAQQKLTMANQATMLRLTQDLTATIQHRSWLESELKRLNAALDAFCGAAKRKQGENCSQCTHALFRKPNGKYACGGGIYCLNCGAHN